MSALKKDVIVGIFKVLAKFFAIVVALYGVFSLLFHFGDLQRLVLLLSSRLRRIGPQSANRLSTPLFARIAFSSSWKWILSPMALPGV